MTADTISAPPRRPLEQQLEVIAAQLEECARSLDSEPLKLPAHARIVENGAMSLRLAGEAIAQLRQDHAAEIRDLQREIREATTDAYHEGRAAGSEDWP